MESKAINNKYVLVEKLPEEKKEGFQTVEIQNDYVYKGKITKTATVPQYVDDYQLNVGDVIVWAKYSPDTHEIDKHKFVAIQDILAVL